jgi:hypothetical protein
VIALAPALAASLLAGASGDVLRLDAQLVGEGRTRALHVEGDPAHVYAGLDVTPRITLTLALPELKADTWYGVRVLAPDLADRGADLIHQLQLKGEKALPGGLRVFATALGAYGRTELVTGEVRDADGVQQVATVATISYVGAQVTPGAAWRLAPRDDVGLSVGWFARGGADPASRRSLPLQRGLRVDGSWTRTATPRDTLLTAMSATAATLEPGGDNAVAQLALTWRRRLTGALLGRLGAGAATTWSSAPGRARERRPLPVCELGFAYASAFATFDGDIGLRAVPFLDSLSGSFEERLEGKARARWRVSASWGLAAEASGGVAPWRVGGDALTSRAELRAEWTVSPRVALAGGFSGVWQRSRRPDLLTFEQYGLFVGARLDTLPR